jgi:serine phosphatase RsbU (regulator of sigma subunit)
VGAVDYIHKPFSPAVVAARVQTHLALRETRGQLERQLQTIQHELDTAREIQLSILPQELPEIAGLDIAASYIPMTSVAGDFYDFAVIDDHTVGILVADVSGHGMPAALIASMLKIAFSAQAAHAGDPVKVLSGLNQALYGKFQVHYVTAAYVLIDTAKQTLTYAGAGHPPLLLRDGATGTVREVLETGLFLGYFPNVVYTSIEVPFGKGDWVLLYTDGIPEMSNAADEQFGEAGLKQYLQEHGSVPAAEFASALLKHLSEWSGTASGREPDDDVTLLAIQFLPGA